MVKRWQVCHCAVRMTRGLSQVGRVPETGRVKRWMDRYIHKEMAGWGDRWMTI